MSMLTSDLSPYTPISVFSGLPLFIECIAGFDDHLLVGTKEGHLLIYKINIKNYGIQPEIILVYSNKHFSRKPILQLDVIPEHKILISLTADNGITIHDMGLFSCQTISTIEKTKGAHLFYLEITRHTSLTGDPAITVRMCVCVGKKLQLFYWKNRAFFELRDDLCVPEIPRSICWIKETLCIGFKNEFCLLSLTTGEQEELFPTTKYTEPIIIKISSDTFGLVKEKQAILIGIDRSVENQVIQWNEIPGAIAYDEPYIISVQVGGKGGVEIRTVNPKLLMDTIQLPGAKLIISTQIGWVFIASNNSIWCLKSLPVENQIESLLKQKQFELALSLANLWDEIDEERKKKINYIQNLHAFDLFCNKKFQESMDIYFKLEMDITQVIGLFPNLLPEIFRTQLETPGVVPILKGIDLEDAISALIVYLTQERNNLKTNLSTLQSLQSPNSEQEKSMSASKRKLQIIDTILLKCYLQTKESLVSSLLRLKENYCHMEESERALKERKKWNELILLYQTRNYHRKALEILLKQKNYERMISYLQHLGTEELDLILEFSRHALQADPQEGLKIFICDDIVDSFPRVRIFDFLLKGFKHLVISYLEHIIHVWHEDNPIFHNALIHQYLEKLKSTEFESDEDRQNNEVRNSLVTFLKSSKFYSSEVILVQFPYDDFYEERALILERLNRHEQALLIYIVVLKDMNKALEYCSNVYNKSDSTKKDIFTILMRMIMSPPTTLMPGIVIDPESSLKPDLEVAKMLLRDYAPYFEPSGVLNCLPDELSVHEMQNFLKSSVQKHLSEKRRVLLEKGLVQSEFLRASADKIYCESENFHLSDNTVCIVCRKRFQETNAFARYPDGSIVHFSCKI